MSEDIGFVGLGDIGLPMALRLQEVTGPIAVWNRTAAKAEPILAGGGRLLASPAALARECRLIGLCLLSDDAVEDVVFGAEGLLGAAAGEGLVLVNLSTGVPERSRAFAARAAERGVAWLDAPVSGGAPAARDGTLTLFLGGDAGTIARAEPLLAAISARWTVMGGPGAGQVTKLCNQLIVAASLMAIAEATAGGRRAGIDVACLAEALGGGFADSRPLQIFGPRMAGHVYEPRLGAIGLMLKDVEAARGMIAEVGGASPLADFLAEAYRSGPERAGVGLDQDLAALVACFEGAGFPMGEPSC